MLYLLDASVLITAHHHYYPVDGVPEYWEWLTFMGQQGSVKLPFEIFDEIKEGPDGEKDLLFAWLQDAATKDALLLPDNVDVALVQEVISDGYAPDLTDDEVEYMGRDPFLIAHALAAADRCVVTAEISKPTLQRHKRKIPDVCNTFGQLWHDPFKFNRALGFRTKWKQDYGL